MQPKTIQLVKRMLKRGLGWRKNSLYKLPNKVMTIIDTRYTEGKFLIEYLINNKEVSFVSEAENNFKKTPLLCTASYFEHQITSIIKEFAKLHSQANPMIMSYIEIQGINRKCHTLFNWDSGNINQFLGNFGAAFKESFNAKIKSEKELEIGVKSFIELGSDRNSLFKIQRSKHLC